MMKTEFFMSGKWYVKRERPMKTIFKDKNGTPVYVLGLQSHNSSFGCPEMIEKSISAVKKYHGNTLEVPVYWYQIEPEEGRFDMSMVKNLIEKVRESGLHLVLLWFGFSKNADCTYLPEWAKSDPERFRLARDRDGGVVPMMSPHCGETIEADRRAFVELVTFLKRFDEAQRTVIALQVENEIGLYPIDRCYSETAQKDFEKGVPECLFDIKLEGSCATGQGNSWYDRFGRYANEAFSSWYFGRAVERIASAGKAIYPGLPLYMNTMQGEVRQEIAGQSYSSGSPVARVLDIWKKAAPSIELFAPDLYCQPLSAYRRACRLYGRENNPLFIPETGTGGEAFAVNLIHAAGDYGAIGICGFGAERTLGPDGELTDAARKVAITMRILESMVPLLLKYGGTDKLFAVSQEEYQRSVYVERTQYHVTCDFSNYSSKGSSLWTSLRTDAVLREYPRVFEERGRGLICETAPDEFYLAGVGLSVHFLLKAAPDDPYPKRIYSSRAATELTALAVEEGHFDGKGNWICDFVRRGDENDYGVFVYPGTVVRVKLNPTACRDVRW